MTLGGDLWFYVSIVGLGVSVLLWPCLFILYRRASRLEEPEAEDDSTLEPLVPLSASPQPASVKPLAGVQKLAPLSLQPMSKPSAAPGGAYSPGTAGKEVHPLPAAQASLAPVSAPQRTQAASAPAAAAPAKLAPVSVSMGGATQKLAASGELRTGQTTPGGISPAVVYLQGVKAQLDRLDKDVKTIREQISSVTQKQEAQFQSVLQHLEYLGAFLRSRVEFSEAPSEAAEAAAAPSAAGPAAEEARPLPAQNSVGIDLIPPIELPPEEASAVSDAPSTEAPSAKRKGPVWPV